MTRGREENRVLVVTEQRQDEHELPRESPPLEVLESILRHQGADRSAHDVLRVSLARLEDRSLLRDLVHEAQRRVDELAGPDRSTEIAALTGCADVEAVEERLRLAEIAVKRAEKEHRSNTRIWNELHHARYGVSKVHEARRDLDALTVYQDRRARWLNDHPSEVGWVAELEARLSEAEQNYQSLVAERTPPGLARRHRGRRKRMTPLRDRGPAHKDSGPSRRSGAWNGTTPATPRPRRRFHRQPDREGRPSLLDVSMLGVMRHSQPPMNGTSRSLRRPALARVLGQSCPCRSPTMGVAAVLVAAGSAAILSRRRSAVRRDPPVGNTSSSLVLVGMLRVR
jgi:hypothetical protein